MSQTILITGASSGIGKSTAKYFQAKGWNVIATMRTPDKEEELSQLDNVLVARLDVTDEASIKAAVNESIVKFGKIDVLLNNAGYGAYGPLETFPMDNIVRQFNTNVIGLLATTKAVLPHFRANKSGIVINVSSVGGKITLPLGTLYHGTKWAVEGLTEALRYELEEIGCTAKIVEPGAIRTDFGGRSFDFQYDQSAAEYQNIVTKVMSAVEEFFKNPSEPEVVAEAVWQAATDGTNTIRYIAGEDAKQFIAQRAAADDETFTAGVKQMLGL